jgi:hypothetical protein
MSDQDQFSPKNRSLLTIILLAVGVTLSLVGVAMWFVDISRDTPLIILKADTEPFKVEPENPGGLTINSQNSPVMEILEKAQEDQTGKEVLLPPESEPELPPIAVSEDQPPSSTTDKVEAGETVAAITKPETPQVTSETLDIQKSGESNPTDTPVQEVVTETPQEKEVSGSDPAQTKTSNQENAILPEGKIVENSEETPEKSSSDATVSQVSETMEENNTVKPENIDDAVASVLNTPIETLPKKRPRTDDGRPYFVIQFAAFKTEKSAKTTAALLSQKHAERLDGIEIGHIKRGEYWRVVSDPMPRADAAKLCSVFRSVGQDCITKLLEDTP